MLAGGRAAPRLVGGLPERGELFAGLERTPALLVAVSGGPDSTALLHLLAHWSAALPEPRPVLHVATVDHGLRAGSGAEATAVAGAAAALGLRHAILTWDGAKPATRVQERARAARYALLAEEAGAIGASHVLTAHHADDQAETVLLRLARGSGPAGLAAMRRESPLAPGLTLARPLLGCRKAALVAFCRAEGLAFAEDPSNRDRAYARVRLRALAPEAAALGLDVRTLVRLADRLARAEEALEAQARRCFAALGGVGEVGRFVACAAPLAETPAEIVLRVVRLALAAAVPDAAPPRLDRLERLAAALHEAVRRGEAMRATLGGARIALGRNTMLVVEREGVRRRGILEAGADLRR